VPLSTGTASKKIKIYLYLIHIELGKETIAFTLPSPPRSCIAYAYIPVKRRVCFTPANRNPE